MSRHWIDLNNCVVLLFKLLLYYKPYYFTVLRCQRLFPPLNGFLVGHCDNTYGTTCRIQCNDGYDLIGADNITCEVERGHITGYWNWHQRAPAVCKGRQMTVKKKKDK